MKAFKGTKNQASVEVSGSTYISGGCLVAVDATGYAVQGAATSGHKILGVSSKFVDNTAGSAGAVKAGFIFNTLVKMSADSTITRTSVGSMAYASGTAPCTTLKASGTAVNNEVGQIVEYESDGVWVWVGADNKTDL
jgi:hypothetical protein